MSTSSNEDTSQKNLFWQSWQAKHGPTLIRHYSFGDYTPDFVHVVSRTILEFDTFANETVRKQCKGEGWLFIRLNLYSVERNVDGYAAGLIKYVENREAKSNNSAIPEEHKIINLKGPVEHEESGTTNPIERTEIRIVTPPVNRCTLCGREIPLRFELCYTCQARERAKLPQRKIIQWAKEMMLRDDCIIFDTETTGTYKWSEILEIAILDSQGKTLLDQLVKPKYSIPHAATEVHGITKEDVKDAPTFADIWPQIAKYFEKSMVLAFNIPFDLRMLKQSAHHYKIDLPETIQHECIMQKFASYQRALDKKQPKKISLEDACEQFGISPAGKHRALPDAQAAWDVLKKLSESE